MSPIERSGGPPAGAAIGADRPPLLRDCVISRDRVVDRLRGADDARVVTVCAPPGYGKSTAVRLWDGADERPFAWVHLHADDGDPTILLSNVADALQSVAPVDDRSRQHLRELRSSMDAMLTVLVEEMAAHDPFVLVLDDMTAVHARVVCETIVPLIQQAQAGTQLVLITDSPAHLHECNPAPDLPTCSVTAVDLAVDESDAARLFAVRGIEIDSDELARIVHLTEGWPGAIVLWSTAMVHAGHDHELGRSRLDSLAEEFVLEVVLEGVSDRHVGFLESLAIVGPLTPAQFDDVLGVDDSSKVLEEVEQSLGLPLVVSDSDGGSWRCHRLLRSVLRSFLEREDPQRARELHRRASRLHQKAGDLERAVTESLLADEPRQAGGIVLAQVPSLAATGRLGLLEQLLALFDRSALDRSPELAIASAWWALHTGDASAAARSIQVARRMDPSMQLTDGSSSLGVALSAVEAYAGTNGFGRLLTECEAVRKAGDAMTNPWRGVATLLEGIAYSTVGLDDLAEARLGEAMELFADAPGFEAVIRAHQGLLALRRNDLVEAEQQAIRAMRIYRDNDLDCVLTRVRVFTTGAAVLAAAGRSEESDAAALMVQPVMVTLEDLAPTDAFSGYLLLARAAWRLGRVAEARAWADDAQRVSQRARSAIQLMIDLDVLRGEIDATDPCVGNETIPIVLSPAESHVLALLPTHLTMGQIADQRFVSRHTVKSQAVAVYRKLGVSSRSEAVEAARQLGLLEGSSRMRSEETQPR